MQLEREERESVVLNWWGIDNKDNIFEKLPLELQQEITSEGQPTTHIMDKKYNPLLIEAIATEFIGVKNSYLSENVSLILNETVLVEGESEILVPCPCCQYQTLEERGQYYICTVYFWEDDGSNDIEVYSGANHMTLREGKNNFSKFGAITASLEKSINPEVKQRYSKSGDKY